MGGAERPRPRALLVGKSAPRPYGPRSIHRRATRWKLGGRAQSGFRRPLWLRRCCLDDPLVGSEFSRLGDVSYSTGVVPFARVSATSTGVGRCIAWIEFDSFSVVRDRAVNLPFKAIGVGQVVIGEHVVGIALDHS